MTDSEIAKLCNKIYLHHKDAIDLIFEHKPDRQRIIKTFLEEIIESTNTKEIELDHCTKTIVRFAPKKWDNSPDQGKGEKWTSSKRILLFEFHNFTESLELKLILGPGDFAVREKLYKIFENDNVRLCKKTSDYITLFRKEFLNKKSYKISNSDEILNIIDERWEEFISCDFDTLLKRINW